MAPKYPKFAVPQNSEELAELLLNDDAREKLLSDPEGFGEIIGKYTSNFAKTDPDFQQQIEEAKDKGVTGWLESLGMEKSDVEGLKSARLPMFDGSDDRGTQSIYRDLNLTREERRQVAATGEGPGVDISGQWKNIGEFVQAMSPHVTHKAMDARLKVLNEGQGDQGGFLVPDEFRAELLRLSLEDAVVRPRARVVPMSGLTLRYPSIRDTSHASNVFGGVTGYWTPESGTITQSEPTFSSVVLTAKKLVAGTRVANELIRDSAMSVEGLLNDLLPSALSYFEDDAFINGSGAGQPVGILNADALVSVAKETGQAASTLLTENVIKMYSRMLPRSIPRSVWVMHPDVQPQLFSMSLSVGTGGAPMFFPAGGMTGSPTPNLLGRPVILSEKCQTLGTAGDIYLVDLSYYLVGDRQAMEMASSSHVRFNTDETDIRIIQRVDGRPWIDSALTPRNGSNTLSPFVALATRS